MSNIVDLINEEEMQETLDSFDGLLAVRVKNQSRQTGFNGILCFNKNVSIVYTYTLDNHINSFYTSYKYIAAYV